MPMLQGFAEDESNESWHPECYVIHRSWNVKLVSTPRSFMSASLEDEERVRMERKVHRVLTVLSAFEQSSATHILDVYRALNEKRYLKAVRVAQKLVLHIETLFAVMDDLDFHFARLRSQSLSYVDDAWKLCRKVVDLFAVASRTSQGPGSLTTDLSNTVKDIAQNMRALIQTALSVALELEHETEGKSLEETLDKLNYLLDTEAGNQPARKLVGDCYHPGPASDATINPSTQGLMFGFRSLVPEHAGESPFDGYVRGLQGEDQSNQLLADLCVKCGNIIEEGCVRLGTCQRWHIECLKCTECGQSGKSREGISKQSASVHLYTYEVMPETTRSGKDKAASRAPVVFMCPDHAHAGSHRGFEIVHPVEQYAFLLHMALRKFYMWQRDDKHRVTSTGSIRRIKDQDVHGERIRISVNDVQEKGMEQSSVRGASQNPLHVITRAQNADPRLCLVDQVLLMLGVCQCFCTAWIPPFGLFSQSVGQFDTDYQVLSAMVVLSSWVWTAILLEHNARPSQTHPLTRSKAHFSLYVLLTFLWTVLAAFQFTEDPRACANLVNISDKADLGPISCVPRIATGVIALLLSILSLLTAIMVYLDRGREEESEKRFA
ncbi:hypothetical protein FB446DRAFT_785042 [Lentinula raphanica]|nr:hypothetical protein FB446DRAFT_785042 [Lentinula raphanica]